MVFGARWKEHRMATQEGIPPTFARDRGAIDIIGVQQPTGWTAILNMPPRPQGGPGTAEDPHRHAIHVDHYRLWGLIHVVDSEQAWKVHKSALNCPGMLRPDSAE